MSNYPPGVTGHEPAIAGHGERTEEVECLQQDSTVLYRYGVLEVVDGALHKAREQVRRNERVGPGDLLGYLRAMRQALDELPETEAPCEWEGEVEGWPVDDDFEWTCPQCGRDNVDRGRYEPDPDEGRD